jgi:hypothetical protein
MQDPGNSWPRRPYRARPYASTAVRTPNLARMKEWGNQSTLTAPLFFNPGGTKM